MKYSYSLKIIFSLRQLLLVEFGKFHFTLVPNLKVCQNKNSYVSHIPKSHMDFCTGMRKHSVWKAKKNETKPKQWEWRLHQHHGIWREVIWKKSLWTTFPLLKQNPFTRNFLTHFKFLRNTLYVPKEKIWRQAKILYWS